MFDQLDDPDGFAPSATFRAGVGQRARRLHRRRRARRVATVAAIPVIGLGAAAIGVDRRLDSVQRVDIAGDGRPDPLDTGAPVTLLLLGTDAAPDDPARAEVIGVRSDVIVVVRIDPSTRTTSTVSIPRDVWTGHGKLNALPPAEVAAWVREHLDIEVDHLISMDMDGFARLADRVEPRVRVELPVRDRSSGLHLEAGCQTLDGAQALAYVRARHLEDRPGGPDSWQADPTGDLGRVARVQSLLITAWNQMGRLDATDAPALADVLVEHATLDAGLSSRDLVRLARWASGEGTELHSSTLPVRPSTTRDGQSVLVPSTEEELLAIPPGDRPAAARAAALGLVSPC